MTPFRVLVPLGCCVIWLAGCGEPEIKSYRVPKEKEVAAAPSLPAASADPSAGLVWKTPGGWLEQPADGMRKASFKIVGENGQKADISVTQFPGSVGGDLANVNRWRGQIDLPPVSDDQLGTLITTVDAPAGKVQLVDLVATASPQAGKPAQQILGAWFKESDRVWFFKMVGDSPLVTGQKSTFVEFLRSLSRGVASAPMPAMAEAPAVSAAPPSENPLTWKAPADWSAKALGQMRKGSFAVKGADGQEADVSIISFPGEAGGLAENLNRWRGQVKLPPQSATELNGGITPVESGTLKFAVVDYLGTGANGPARLLGAVLPLGDQTYFFKMIGPDALVAAKKPAFIEFLKTVSTH